MDLSAEASSTDGLIFEYTSMDQSNAKKTALQLDK